MTTYCLVPMAGEREIVDGQLPLRWLFQRRGPSRRPCRSPPGVQPRRRYNCLMSTPVVGDLCRRRRCRNAWCGDDEEGKYKVRNGIILVGVVSASAIKRDCTLGGMDSAREEEEKRRGDLVTFQDNTCIPLPPRDLFYRYICILTRKEFGLNQQFSGGSFFERMVRSGTRSLWFILLKKMQYLKLNCQNCPLVCGDKRCL